MSNLQIRSIAHLNARVPETKQMEQEVKMQMAKDMAQVLTACSGKKAKWKATKTDLMEAIHWTWLNDTVVGADGSPCEFAQLVSRACTLFAIREPRNPRTLVCHALMKKGIRARSLVSRCLIIAVTEHTSHPLMRFIAIQE